MTQTTNPTLSGEGLALARARLRQRIRRGGTDVRVSQAVVYAAFRQREIDRNRYPAANAFLKLSADGERGTTQMAVKACRMAGYAYSSADKACRRVRSELSEIGEPHKWKSAKIKSGPRGPRCG